MEPDTGQNSLLSNLRQFFDTQVLDPLRDRETADPEHSYQLATAVLLLEVTRANYNVKAIEQETVVRAIQTAFDLPPGETAELVALAEHEVDHAVCLHDFTSKLNQSFSAEEKRHVVELMWKVGFADGEVDKYEEYVIRKVTDLLYVKHRDFVQAKHRVQRELGLE